MRNKFSPELILELTNIFKDKGWPLSDEYYDHPDHPFNCFCQILETLPKEQIDLILALTRDFKIYDHGIWAELLSFCLGQIIIYYGIDYFHGFDRIFIVPILPTNAIYSYEVHSGSSLIYPAQTKLRELTKGDINIEGLLNPININNSVLEHHLKSAFVIFIDDFIGTGDSANDTIKDVKLKLDKSCAYEIYILSLVALHDGILFLYNKGYNVLASRIIYKGIKYSHRITDKTNAYSIMTTIENDLSILPINRFGYKQSEALIKMIRTPDNTFPVFWCDTYTSGKRRPAPFRRI